LLAEFSLNELFFLSFFILEVQPCLVNSSTEVIKFWLSILHSQWNAVRQRLGLVQYQTVDAIMLPQRQTIRWQHLSLHRQAHHCWAMRAWA